MVSEYDVTDIVPYLCHKNCVKIYWIIVLSVG